MSPRAVSRLTLRSRALNAFTPALEVLDPTRFAGRQDVVRRLTDALHTIGQCPVIFGDRGLGKSSLAKQVVGIALGDLTLLAEHSLEHLAFTAENSFIVFIVTCTDNITTKDQLLQRLINTAEGFQNEAGLERLRLRGKTTEKGFKLAAFEAKVKKEWEKQQSVSYASLNVEEKLTAVVNLVTEETGRAVLLVVDEVDRVKSTAGLASYFKSVVSEDLKFLVVGVGDTVANLVHDYESAPRMLRPVEVQRMNASELALIVSKVQVYLAASGVDLTFSQDAVDALVGAAGGFPWYVHLLGQQAVVAAFDSQVRVIKRTHVENAMDALATNEHAARYNDTYLKAISNSRHRELVLRLFAHYGGNEIPTGDLYVAAREGLGVRNPSSYVSDLCKAQYGRALGRARAMTDGSLYVFHDAMFKRYVRLRRPEYAGTEELLSTALTKFLGGVT